MMKNIVQLVREHRFTEAEDQIDNAIPLIMEKKLFEMKKAVAAKMCEHMGVKTASKKVRLDIMEDEIEEMDVSKEKPEYNDIEDKRKEKAVKLFLLVLYESYGVKISNFFFKGCFS